MDCEVLVPAAISNQINGKNVEQIKAQVVLEMANGPTTPEADKIFDQNNVLVVPDILANSGGVIVSYFEWLQNNSENYWSEEEVDSELKERMIPAFNAVWDTAEKYKIDLRTAAFVKALARIAEAEKVRH